MHDRPTDRPPLSVVSTLLVPSLSGARPRAYSSRHFSGVALRLYLGSCYLYDRIFYPACSSTIPVQQWTRTADTTEYLRVKNKNRTRSGSIQEHTWGQKKEEGGDGLD